MARKTPVSHSNDNGSPPNQSFAETAKEMLETALALQANHRPLSCAEIEDPMREVCTGAQKRGIKVERLIVDLKEVWHSVPDSTVHQKADVISRLVTMCILEFYRTPPSETGDK
jgi:tRNA A58 N-methylase Trm61